MKSLKQLKSAVLVALVVLTSCRKDALTGSGSIVTQQRTVANFTKVKVNGETDVNIIQGTTFKVEVSDYSNLVNEIETIVIGDELIVGYRQNINVFRGKSLVTITMPVLKSIIVNGSGDAKINGAFTTDNCIAKVSGSGDIWISSLTLTNDFTSNIYGSGNITITNGLCDKAIFNLNGSGDINAFGMQSNTANINVNGSSDTELTVNNQLTASINGSGNIFYKGTALVNSTILGSGRVYKR
jgi:hypothetical protein